MPIKYPKIKRLIVAGFVFVTIGICLVVLTLSKPKSSGVSIELQAFNKLPNATYAVFNISNKTDQVVAYQVKFLEYFEAGAWTRQVLPFSEVKHLPESGIEAFTFDGPGQKPWRLGISTQESLTIIPNLMKRVEASIKSRDPKLLTGWQYFTSESIMLTPEMNSASH
jgi:hypothetical protein